MDSRIGDILFPELAPRSLLASLPENLLRQLLAQQVLELPAGAPVFERSARCGGFPLLLSGAVRNLGYRQR